MQNEGSIAAPKLWLLSLKIVAVYLIYSLAWVYFSDRLALILIKNPVYLTQLQTIKGFLYVGIASLILYGFLWRTLANLMKSKMELKDTETRWNSLVENAQDLIIIMNKSGKIRFSNRTLYTTYGKKARTIFDITAAESENIFLTAVKEVYRHKNHELIEIPLYTRGEEKQWFKIRIAPILRDHKVMAVICTAKDVSELKAKENKKFLLEEAIHAVNESVIITDMENKIIFVNRTFSEIYGYRDEEVLGQTIDLIRSKLTSTLIRKEAFAATLQGGWKGEVYHRKKDGSDFPVLVRNSIIKNKNDKPVAIIRSTRPLSEGKKVNENPAHPDQVQDQQSQEIEFN